MIQEVRDSFGDAMKTSGKPFTFGLFFMALLLSQQKTIELLLEQLRAYGVDDENE